MRIRWHRDPDNDVVVVDLPPAAADDVWESAAACLPRCENGVRLVAGDRSRELVTLGAQGLATMPGELHPWLRFTTTRSPLHAK
ncbi:hypothetical protein [Actinophytocola oryzae]|uniref:Uncharacterized protein n=1 Tax=Actinophytocola oryzae TaxID=502181 RepID=A0A4R7VH60_9PSEU|nr:hypothetical protein [Actinophytocola oryzae]TDV48666.1 hypothetical protein CLV71_10826 [Actinophytocola oryzae]